jgi:hypothetical protein
MKTQNMHNNIYRDLDVNDRFSDYRSQIMKFILGFQNATRHEEKLVALEMFICATDRLENQMAALIHKPA